MDYTCTVAKAKQIPIIVALQVYAERALSSLFPPALATTLEYYRLHTRVKSIQSSHIQPTRTLHMSGVWKLSVLADRLHVSWSS